MERSGYLIIFQKPYDYTRGAARLPLRGEYPLRQQQALPLQKSLNAPHDNKRFRRSIIWILYKHVIYIFIDFGLIFIISPSQKKRLGFLRINLQEYPILPLAAKSIIFRPVMLPG